MKRLSRVGLATIMVLLCHGIALGESNPFGDAITKAPNLKNRLLAGLSDDRLSLTTAYKMWIANWQSFSFVRFFVPPTTVTPTTPTQFTSDVTFFSGPSITGSYRIRDSEWFHTVGVNFTWLVAGGWEFSDSSFGRPPPGLTAKRRDYSITGSLAIWRGIGIFGGYYNTQQDLSIFDVRFSGPIIGVYGSGGINKRVGVYGNLALAFLDYKGSAGTISNDVKGYSTEWGFNINGPDVWKMGTGMQIGYRAQVLRVTGSGNLTTNDITWGPTITLLAKF